MDLLGTKAVCISRTIKFIKSFAPSQVCTRSPSRLLGKLPSLGLDCTVGLKAAPVTWSLHSSCTKEMLLQVGINVIDTGSMEDNSG